MNEKINVNVTIKPWNLMLVGALTAIFVVLKVLGYIIGVGYGCYHHSGLTSE
ncbi:MAG: hypothetical protein IJ880_16295 [Bacilli bacterium]|nr:hypothetical protein [Bacilli bacterium]